VVPSLLLRHHLVSANTSRRVRVRRDPRVAGVHRSFGEREKEREMW